MTGMACLPNYDVFFQYRSPHDLHHLFILAVLKHPKQYSECKKPPRDLHNVHILKYFGYQCTKYTALPLQEGWSFSSFRHLQRTGREKWA